MGHSNKGEFDFGGGEVLCDFRGTSTDVQGSPSVTGHRRDFPGSQLDGVLLEGLQTLHTGDDNFLELFERVGLEGHPRQSLNYSSK